MIPDYSNTLTCQSAAAYDAPRDPLYVPITWNPACTRPESTLCLHLCYQHIRWCRFSCDHHCRIINLTKNLSFIRCKCCQQHQNFCAAPLSWFDAPFLIRLTSPNSNQINRFDSTPVSRKYFFDLSHSWDTSLGVPYNPKCPTNNSTAKLWNFPGFWKINWFCRGHSTFIKKQRRERSRRTPPPAPPPPKQV